MGLRICTSINNAEQYPLESTQKEIHLVGGPFRKRTMFVDKTVVELLVPHDYFDTNTPDAYLGLRTRIRDYRYYYKEMSPGNDYFMYDKRKNYRG